MLGKKFLSRLRGTRLLVSLAAVAAVVLVAVTLHPLTARDDENPPAFHGNVRQFTLIRPLRPAPLRTFHDAKGRELDLSNFRGKVVVLNFWATWCGPCVREMPALDRLQADLGGERFAVVTLSLDRGGAAIAEPFFARLGLKHLTLYLDARWASYHAFGARGLPTSYLIDAKGTVRGYLEGVAEWDGKKAKKLIRYYLDRPGVDARPKPAATP